MYFSVSFHISMRKISHQKRVLRIHFLASIKTSLFFNQKSRKWVYDLARPRVFQCFECSQFLAVIYAGILLILSVHLYALVRCVHFQNLINCILQCLGQDLVVHRGG